jgi:chromate reductase
MTEDRLKIIGIAGSLRKRSYNRFLLEAARELSQDIFDINLYDLSGIPMYDGDLDNDISRPVAAEKFKLAIAESDGMLIATPEYNYSIPGVLKNAIDWASRPVNSSPLNMKPLGIMSTSGGMYGGVRAQNHLRQIVQSANMMDMKRPEMIVPKEQEKFDSTGKLIDEGTKLHLLKYIAAYEKWIHIFKTNFIMS